MTRPTLKPLLFAAALLTGATGLALPTAAQAQAFVSVQIGPPPPPRFEVVPATRPGYVWAPGHYEWLHGNYVWRRGYWTTARPGYAYVAPTWVADGPRWVYHPGRWDRHPGQAGPRPWGDRDHDGVRNRRDRHPRDRHRY